MRRFFVGLLCSALTLAGCSAIPDPGQRADTAARLAQAQSWQAHRFQAGPFELLAYTSFSPASPQPGVNDPSPLFLYVEGDGLAWVTGRTPSADPTPRNPVALQLALAQQRARPAQPVAWVARPCQYADAERTGCPQRYWTDARFAPEVIDALDHAATVLKQRAGATSLVLVGYSGGGAVAALLAARRSDIAALITVAGNLDHAAWTRHHRVRPLADSLNPADIAPQLAGLKQRHFIGQSDTVISPDLANQWPAPLQGPDRRHLTILKGQDHGCCWEQAWPGLLRGFPSIDVR